MDIISVAKMIEKAIAAIGEEGAKSAKLSEDRARAMLERDKAIALAILKHRSEGIPVSLIDKLVRADEKVLEATYRYEVAESAYRAHFARMENLRAQLNGLQSIYKHLD